MQIRRLSYCMGAQISDIDIREPMDDHRFMEIYSAFLEHGILLIRGQPLTVEQHLDFSRRFGELEDNSSAPRLQHPKYPEIILNKPAPGKRSHNGEVWHSDQSYTLAPAKASLLRAVEIPEVGGDTMFANLYLAYEALSDGMKKLLEGLHGVHFGGKARMDNSSAEKLAKSKRINAPIAQPLVREHPETGRKSLYLGDKVKQIVGMTTAESAPLLEFLCAHAVRPQFTYRHVWQKDDLIIWDNRCTNHIALGDYDWKQVRHMERTTIRGTPSGYVYEGPLEYEGPRL